MAAAIEKAVEGATVELIDGGRGDFIVKRDDDLLWDKKGMGNQFPDDAAIVAKLGG